MDTIRESMTSTGRGLRRIRSETFEQRAVPDGSCVLVVRVRGAGRPLAAGQLAADSQLRGRVTGRRPGGVLPGVTVELRSEGAAPLETVTDMAGEYSFERRGARQVSGGIHVDQFRVRPSSRRQDEAGVTRGDAAITSRQRGIAVVGKRHSRSGGHGVSGRATGRRRAVGQSRRHHRTPARRSADHACRRGA